MSALHDWLIYSPGPILIGAVAIGVPLGLLVNGVIDDWVKR